MVTKRIYFTEPCVAKLVEEELAPPAAGQAQVKIQISTISSGTERANLIGDVNINSTKPAAEVAKFPRCGGYSSAGTVVAVGEGVTDLKPGDRVAVFWSKHGTYMNVSTKDLLKLPDDVPFEEAALWNIATFPMAAIRKCRLEMGESAIVMGQGVLGQMAVMELRAAGAVPIIAVDPAEHKRKQALEIGADYALDPFDPDFAKKAKELTGGGAKVGIEVTGIGAGLNGILDCMKKYGRVALLGCTRSSDFTIDYYRKVHGPGITLVGAHTQARASAESSHGNYTAADDIRVQFKLLHMNRLCYTDIIHEVHNPRDCTEVYNRLVTDKNFPVCVQYKWDNI